MRIAIFAHGHPEIQSGGAERAAYTLFQSLKKIEGIEAIFVARAASDLVGHDSAFGAFRGRNDEIVWCPPSMNLTRLCSGDAFWLERHLSELCAYLKPDLVHIHHYVHFGLDIFPLIKSKLDIPVVLTLHEYVMICKNQGQMYKTTNKLCYQASHAECSQCFPEITAGKFFLRKAYIEQCLSYVDHFISPSHFLIDRYVGWGLEKGRLSMIENLVNIEQGDDFKVVPYDDGQNRRLKLGFFGQINHFKGVHILLDALHSLPEKILEKVDLHIFGANLDLQNDQFKKKFTKKIKKLSKNISLEGSYRNEDVISLMRTVDWVVIPSIWWENSPLVIQEAAAAGVPILGSNIGGMKEKIISGQTGDHFLVGSSVDLARKIIDIVEGRLVVIPPSYSVEEQNDKRRNEHFKVYESLIGS